MFKKELLKLQDSAYKNFHKKLIPTADENRIIGIRVLRAFAKAAIKDDEQKCKKFMSRIPHTYFVLFRRPNILMAIRY